MKNVHLFLFCGGLSIDSAGEPKPLMKLFEGKSLIKYYLRYIASSEILPDSVTLLCDMGQKKDFLLDLTGFKFPIDIEILESKENSTTFDKFIMALDCHGGETRLLHFSYPDIFFFGDTPQPGKFIPYLDNGAAISVAALSSRFPRLIVDIYGDNIKGISDHASLMPANPLHVFGGDLWGRKEVLRRLSLQFLEHKYSQKQSLEYDFFFWLINRGQVKSVVLNGEWIHVDSVRDVRILLNHLPN